MKDSFLMILGIYFVPNPHRHMDFHDFYGRINPPNNKEGVPVRGLLHDKDDAEKGTSFIKDVNISDREISFTKYHIRFGIEEEEEVKCHLVKDLNVENLWVGTYEGDIAGKGCMRCFINKASSNFFLPDIAFIRR